MPVKGEWKNPYHFRPCYTCNQPSVGFATDLITIRYYCGRHFADMQKSVDAWLKRHEQQQWGDQQWYREGTRPPTLTETLRGGKRSQSLFDN